MGLQRSVAAVSKTPAQCDSWPSLNLLISSNRHKNECWQIAISLLTSVQCGKEHTHTYTQRVRFSCLIAFHENTHAHSPTHNRHMQKSISVQEVSLQTTPKSVPSDSDTMMMTLPWQHTPQVSCSSGVRALNALDGIFKWWRPFGKQSISWVTQSYCLLLCQVKREIDRQLSKKCGLTKCNYRNIQYKLNSINCICGIMLKKSKIGGCIKTLKLQVNGPNFWRVLKAKIWSLQFYKSTYINYSF